MQAPCCKAHHPLPCPHQRVAPCDERVASLRGCWCCCHRVQVVRVLLEMARADMAREADALAALLSAPGVRKAPQVRAPL